MGIFPLLICLIGGNLWLKVRVITVGGRLSERVPGTVARSANRRSVDRQRGTAAVNHEQRRTARVLIALATYPRGRDKESLTLPEKRTLSLSQAVFAGPPPRRASLPSRMSTRDNIEY